MLAESDVQSLPPELLTFSLTRYVVCKHVVVERWLDCKEALGGYPFLLYKLYLFGMTDQVATS